MDVLYIPQLDEGDAGESPTAGRYRLLKRVPEEGCVALTDRAVTRIEVSATDPLKITVPPLVKGAMRDFFVRLVITADEIPEVTFAAPSGETISFEDVDEEVLKCEVGVNVFAFTETDQGIFAVNRKQVDIDVEVEFDPCGGELDTTRRAYKLGAQYGAFPRPTMTGMLFRGWFTEADGGVKVEEGDRCKTGVTKLYAQWETYVDPFVDAICPAKNLTFFSEDVIPWFVDAGTGVGTPGAARSGLISDSGRTSLTTTVAGRGTLSFMWKVSSESNYDKLHFIVDGMEVANISGEEGWTDVAHTFDGDGPHTVEWKYDKDGSVSSGNDCGWVDEVVWTPGEG